ncbi:hypothetical protein J5X84_38325 [Streptosporangiaceae bacterium NEAU-GS5]|nr:hypothetical protein [Streptosporangiaceae bacterium NEAU-GS5]
MSYLSRYSSGEHEEVWAELRALGPVPDGLIADVNAVAAETMRRLGMHVVRIAEQLGELDFEPSFPDVSLHREPDGAGAAEVDRLKAGIGGLPVALAACLRRWARSGSRVTARR